jgi:hypothetical protein
MWDGDGEESFFLLYIFNVEISFDIVVSLLRRLNYYKSLIIKMTFSEFNFTQSTRYKFVSLFRIAVLKCFCLFCFYFLKISITYFILPNVAFEYSLNCGSVCENTNIYRSMKYSERKV